MLTKSQVTCAAAALGAVIAFSAAVPRSAQAGILTANAPDCDAQTLDRPFLRFLDPAVYTPAPDAGIEDRADGWTLSNGAGPVAGNEPFMVGAPGDRMSLALPAGSRATTAPICVGIGEPTLRFFARRDGAPGSFLLAQVLFEDCFGDVHALTIGADTGGSWHPTAQMPILVNLLPGLPGERTAVAFRFTPVGRADWQIDDVYVDPWQMR